MNHIYLPQRSWGKVIFSEACVNNSVHRGGMHDCSGGACVVFIWGACMVFIWGGMCGFYLGGHAWFYSGACMVLFGGMCGFYSGGRAWFYLGGMGGFIRGACMVLFGGMHGFFSFFQIQWDTVNERAVCILLECILVKYYRVVTTFFKLKKTCLQVFNYYNRLTHNVLLWQKKKPFVVYSELPKILLSLNFDIILK